MATESLRFVLTFRKSQTDITSLKRKIKDFFDEFSKKNLDCSVILGEARNIDIDPIYKAELYELDITLIFENRTKLFKPGEHVKSIGQMWCDPSKNSLSHLWLRLGNRADLENSAKTSHTNIETIEMAFGTLPTMEHFMQHFKYEGMLEQNKKELRSTFLHHQRFFILYACLNHNKNRDNACKNSGKAYKLVVDYKSISRVIVSYVSNEGAVELHFVLRHIPLVYYEKKGKNVEENKGGIEGEFQASDQDYQEKRWERSLIFGCKCNNSEWQITEVGRCPVFKVVLAQKNRAYSIIERLIQRCAANTYFFYSSLKAVIPQIRLGDFDVYPYDKEWFDSLQYEKDVSDKMFLLQFAWKALNGRSSEVEDQLLLKCEMDDRKLDYWHLVIKEYLRKFTRHSKAVSDTLYHISEIIARCEIFTFEDAFLKLFEHYRQYPPNLDLPDGMCLIRRLIITPSRFICLQPSEHFDNRVIRKFGHDHFLRVSIQDDNFSKLTFAVQHHSKKDTFMDLVCCNMLNRIIKIGPRCYEFLASSNSQLREHGLWIFAKDRQGRTAQDIREWMGDFSGIRNVAKYMARMGQCFSSSEEATQIELLPENVESRKDIATSDEKYIFSDGIGMISSELAQEIREALEKKLPFQIDNRQPRYKPSAFQIRFQGCKGMVAENPTLKGRKLIIRPSMNKFPCPSSNLLEIVKISAPRGLFLNRPLITILEQLGVKPNVFMKLQKKMVLDLTDSLIYEKNAWEMMSNMTTLDFPYKRLLKAGVCLTEEPFFRSLLLSVFKVAIDMLRSKSRIAIPPQYGRNMLGVLDETNTLEYGQIFVQYSHELGNSVSDTTVLERTVVVTKNPCMHPGDVRKLQAIDVKALHHIKDCIVFPAKGKRPHPDEMAGSDLDGDEYVVIWYDDLVFPKDNSDPMDYPPNPSTEHSGSITVPDMIDFLSKFIQKDSIGILANAHLAWADSLKEGIFSKVCISIAKKYPLALDFAKSGYTCKLENEEKPKLYPDFMEKGTNKNSYKSKNTLGMLYRVIRTLEACVNKIETGSCPATYDPHFEYDGWEHYEESTEHFMDEYNKRVRNILKKYGLRSESEALTGYAGKMNEYTENRYERDNALSLAKTYLLDAMKRFNLKFYKALEDECSSNNISDLQEIKYRRASAWYVVAYRSVDNPFRSFPWIVHDLLCEIREKKLRMEGLTITVPRSSFIQTSDARLLQTQPKHQATLHGHCYCIMILCNTVQDWMTRSSLNLTVSAEDTLCIECLQRVVNIFRDASDSHKCCSFVPPNECNCTEICSPTKLILKFMKFYATEVQSNAGSCGALADSGLCNGFRELNLQSIALRTYASLAVTRDTHHLGLNDNSASVKDDNANEEGDPIRISVSREFEQMLSNESEKCNAQLKALSGVKEIFFNPDKDPKGNWFILVHSIGREWQRWHLEELLMDEDIVTILRKRLNKKIIF